MSRLAVHRMLVLSGFAVIVAAFALSAVFLASSSSLDPPLWNVVLEEENDLDAIEAKSLPLAFDAQALAATFTPGPESKPAALLLAAAFPHSLAVSSLASRAPPRA